jgi:hypothetical protein
LESEVRCEHTDEYAPPEGNFCDKHGKLKHLSLLKTTVGAWAMSAKETRNYFSIPRPNYIE